MRFHRLTPTGLTKIDVSREGRTVIVRQETTNEAPIVERLECGSDDDAAAKIEAKREELVGAGAVEAIEPVEAARKYFEERFFTRVAENAEKRDPPRVILSTLEERYGFTFPDDLRRLIRLSEEYDLSSVCLGEWQNLDDAFAPFAPGKNLLVQAIELDHANYLGTARAELLSGLVPIGMARNGDVYLAFVDPVRPEGCEVFLWDHEEHELSVFADSIPTLAYLSHLYEIDSGEVEVEGGVLETIKDGLAKIEQRVSPSWHYQSLCEHAEIEPKYEAANHAEFFYVRSAWIRRLTSGRGKNPAVESKGIFFEQLENWHAKQPFEKVLGSPRFGRATLSVYWLFYTYFFDQKENLAQALRLASEAKSAFTRDAAAFFTEVLENEKRGVATQLGRIEDVSALKKEFLEAETAGAKKRRQAEEAERAEAEKQRQFAQADEIARGATIETLERAVREHAEKSQLVQRLYHHLGQFDPEIANAMKRLEIMGNSEDYREHKLALGWLAQHATLRVLPLLRARGMDKQIAAIEMTRSTQGKPAPEVPAVTRDTFGTIRTKGFREKLAALALSGSAEHLALLDEMLERRRGGSVYLVFERAMREALAGRCGKPVVLDAVRKALQTTYSERDRTTTLHLVALKTLAAHAPKDEVRATAMRFLNWELRDVRMAARDVLVSMGETDRTRLIDRTEAEAIFAKDGVEGICAALRDPWAYPKSRLIAVAVANGAGEAIAADAIASFKATYGDFTDGHGYYSGNYDIMLETARGIANLPGAAVDAFIHWVITSHSPLVSPAIDNEELKNRARNVGSIDPDYTEGELTIESFSAPPFVLGGTVHGLAHAAGRIVAGGNAGSAFFDASGKPTPFPAEVRVGWSYDVDVDPSGARVAVGYHACRLVILDVATGNVVAHLRFGGVPNGIRKLKWSPSGRFIATASDDDSIRVVDVATGAEVMSHGEPYDVNGIAWIDEERLAFITDHHVGVLARAGGEPTRIDVGGGADVIVHDGRLIAGTNKEGTVFVDPATMKIEQKLPTKHVSRLRVGPDGTTLWAAVYEGDDAGLVRWTLGSPPTRKQVISGEALFALSLDRATGDLICGGKGGRIHHVTAAGDVLAPPANSHTGSVDALVLEEGGRSVLALDATSRALRWSLEDGSATAPWPAIEASSSPNAVVLLSDGGLVFDAMKQLAVYDGANKRWSTELQRSETAIMMGNEIIVGSGQNLCWRNPKDGASLAEVPAGVKSPWIHYIYPLDDDAFLVAGYDDPKIARWSAKDRASIHSTLLDRRGDDDRFSRPYGMTIAPQSRHLYVAYWNSTVDVIDSKSLELLHTYDVDYAYALLSVDAEERWMVAATSSFLDIIDLRDGRRLARRLVGAEVKSLVVVRPGVALAGLASGEIVRATWSISG